MSVSQALKGAATQKVFKGSRSLDFISNATKSSNLSPLESNIDHSLDQELEETHDFFSKPDTLPHPYKTKPVHPFLRFSKPAQLQRIITRFPDRQNILASKNFSSSLEEEVVTSRGITKPLKYSSALNLLRGTEQLKELEKLQDLEVYIDVDVSGFKLNDLDESIFDKMIHKDQGGYATNEEKMLYLLKNKLSIENFSNETFSDLSHLINKYFDASGSIHSSRTILLAFAQQVINNSTKDLDFSLCQEVLNSALYHFPTLHTDRDLIYAYLRIAVKAKDVNTGFDLVHKLKNLQIAPSSQILNNLLFQLKDKTRDIKRSDRLNELIGLDNVLYTALDGTSVKILTSLSTSVNEVISLLNIIDKKFSIEQRPGQYSQFGNQVIKYVSNVKLDHSIKCEIYKRVIKYTEINESAMNSILKDSISNGSLIYASTFYKKWNLIEHKDHDIKISKLKQLLKERIFSPIDTRPGYTDSNRVHFLQILKNK